VDRRYEPRGHDCLRPGLRWLDIFHLLLLYMFAYFGTLRSSCFRVLLRICNNKRIRRSRPCIISRTEFNPTKSHHHIFFFLNAQVPVFAVLTLYSAFAAFFVFLLYINSTGIPLIGMGIFTWRDATVRTSILSFPQSGSYLGSGTPHETVNLNKCHQKK